MGKMMMLFIGWWVFWSIVQAVVVYRFSRSAIYTEAE